MTLTDDSPWCDERTTNRTEGVVIFAPSLWQSDTSYVRHSAPVSIQVGERHPQWLSEVLDRLVTMSAYPANWNGYGERPIGPKGLGRAAVIAAQVATALPTAAPSAVFPLASGGIEIEWGDEGEVSVEVGATGHAEAYLAEGDYCWPINDRTDLSQLCRYIVEYAVERP